MNTTPPFTSNQDETRQARTINKGANSVHVSAGSPSPPLTVGDVYYVLFRHKWRIILCGFLGLIGAILAYFLNPPPYRSESKLFIRYVFIDEGTSAARGQENQVKTPDQRGETIMDSESEIITSLDLARQVAEVVGPEKILAKAGGGSDLGLAAGLVHQGLVVDIPQRSSVIHVTFYHPDAQVVQPVLREVIRQYYKMHLNIHQAVGIVGDFLTQETDQLRAKLTQTEEELHKATAKAGVSNFDDARKSYADEMARIRSAIYVAQAEYAERKAVYDELMKHAANPSVSPGGEPAIPPEKVSEFRSVNTRLDMLKKRERDLLAEFTPESSRVANIHALIAETETSRRRLVADYPRLEQGSGGSGETSAPAFDPSALTAQLIATQSKITELGRQSDQVKAEAAKLEEAAGSVEDLKRRKDLEEANYRYYAARLEQSRINEALGAGKVSNITEIQTPSPAATDRKKSLKLVGGILFGALALGIGWSFLIELYLDRTVRRPIDLERMFGVPLFLSVPALDRRERRRLKAARDLLALPPGDPALTGTAGARGAEVTDGSLLYSFHETLRDRLIGYFESRGLTHKPKLVAVTGLGRGSGVTTTAAGLASSLSQTAEGNVLLVDMTAGQGSAQHFYRGEKILGLEEILSLPDYGEKPRGTAAQVQDHLYVVGEEPGQERLSRILPQRFTKIVPKLKASNFDYIIFDMPPVSQISITPRLAGFMDMVLMVVESEKTDRELVQRATSLLAQSKAHVGAVLNKSRTYVPSALHQDYLGNG